MYSQKKQKILEWDSNLEEKFQELKRKFKEKPVRGYPIYEGEPFILTTDFSSKNLGAILE